MPLHSLEKAFSGGSVAKHLPDNAENVASIPGWEDPRRRKWQLTPIFLPRKSHGQRSLAGYESMGSQRVRHDWERSCTFRNHKLPPALKPPKTIRKLSGKLTFIYLMFPEFHSLSDSVRGFHHIDMLPYNSHLSLFKKPTQFFQWNELGFCPFYFYFFKKFYMTSRYDFRYDFRILLSIMFQAVCTC